MYPERSMLIMSLIGGKEEIPFVQKADEPRIAATCYEMEIIGSGVRQGLRLC
jgi:hypothetical protein